jgi:2-oxoglutarate ferredoxin oxidoreductase subunit alpha
LKEGLLPRHNQALRRKWESIKKNEQRCYIYKARACDYLIVAYGSQARIAREAVDILRKEKIKAGLFRPVSLWPYPEKALRACAQSAKKVIVVEQSLGQMVEDVRLALPGKEVLFLGKAGGGIPSAQEIVEFVNG